MKFREYQKKALSTALPTALDLENYLIPMIAGETGELFGAQAKAHRDNWPPERIAKELAKEYGDICWGVAVALHMLGVNSLEMETPVQDCADPATDIMNNVLNILDEIDDQITNLKILWYRLSYHALDVTTYTFEQVLEMNVTKLADRQARGAISGSGNDR